MQHITVQELAQWLADPNRAKPVLLDVREPAEFQICRLDNAQLMPMQTVPERISELDADAEIVCICHHGGRSMKVAAYLDSHGFDNVVNLSGGMHAWALQVDTSMPTY